MLPSQVPSTFSGLSLAGSPTMGGIPPPQNPSRTFPSPPSKMEAKFYYAGLPSAPILVARTSTTPWEVPSGPQAYWKLKELHLANSHPIKEV